MSRNKEGYQKYLSDFLQYDIEVVCPECAQQALVKTFQFSFRTGSGSPVKFICISCGHNKFLSEKPQELSGAVLLGAPVDPFFQTPLWLTADFETEVLWAYNQEHLRFLHEHIESTLRERNGQELKNQSIGSRLPKWMTSKKNRENVLKVIERLQKKKN